MELVVRFFLSALLAFGVGCSAEKSPGGGGGGGGDSGTGGGDGGGGGFDAGPRTDGGPGTDAFEMCDGISSEAENLLAPVDIVLVVDSSDSMENDARAVQDNMDDFATYISASGVDFHVVMISDRGFVTPSSLFTSDPMRFLFVDRHVGSSDVFARAIDQFPVYEDFLRPDAITHIVGVTDDDDDMRAASFISMMEGLLGHDFTFHAIASEEAPNPIPYLDPIPCTRSGGLLPAAAIGDRYYDAAAMTGGLTFSICTEDWSGLFDTLAMTVSVSEELPCAYDLPEPPAGMSFDRDRVNVEHTPEGGATTTFPRAADEASCGTGAAWYYDDADDPAQILLCPAACDTVTSGPGRVDVRLGCETLLI